MDPPQSFSFWLPEHGKADRLQANILSCGGRNQQKDLQAAQAAPVRTEGRKDGDPQHGLPGMPVKAAMDKQRNNLLFWNREVWLEGVAPKGRQGQWQDRDQDLV